jgi:hypothetical protein
MNYMGFGEYLARRGYKVRSRTTTIPGEGP